MKDYKKILEGVVNIINTTEKSDIGFANICSYIGEKCPELKESDDEMIRKAIIEHFAGSHSSMYPYKGFTKKQILSWLEKQGNKDSQVTFPTFTFDDVLALQCCMETVKKVQEDKVLYEKLNDLHGRVYDAYQLEKKAEQKQELLTKEKALENSPFVEQKSTWIEEDESIMNAIYKFLGGSDALSVDQQQAKYWLKSIKDRIHPQPKQEWSEEDENIRKKIIKFLKEQNYFDGKVNEFKEPYKKEYEWLKSLRPQSQWKPSDEQMLALEAKLTIPPQSPAMTSALIELYEQLKKLREK